MNFRSYLYTYVTAVIKANSSSQHWQTEITCLFVLQLSTPSDSSILMVVILVNWRSSMVVGGAPCVLMPGGGRRRQLWFVDSSATTRPSLYKVQWPLFC